VSKTPKPRTALDAEALLRRLTARGVDFVVIGGIAAVLHGSARNTFDLDICFATDDANLAALGEVLVELGARLKGVEEELPFVPDAATLRRVEVLSLDTPIGELDVLARPSGAPRYETLRKQAERYDIDGVLVLVASIADLLAMKRAAGRPKDLADIDELEAIVRLRRQDR
jgi:predicted nucleotidyltransferase